MFSCTHAGVAGSSLDVRLGVGLCLSTAELGGAAGAGGMGGGAGARESRVDAFQLALFNFLERPHNLACFAYHFFVYADAFIVIFY